MGGTWVPQEGRAVSISGWESDHPPPARTRNPTPFRRPTYLHPLPDPVRCWPPLPRQRYVARIPGRWEGLHRPTARDLSAETPLGINTGLGRTPEGRHPHFEGGYDPPSKAEPPDLRERGKADLPAAPGWGLGTPHHWHVSTKGPSPRQAREREASHPGVSPVSRKVGETKTLALQPLNPPP